MDDLSSNLSRGALFSNCLPGDGSQRPERCIPPRQAGSQNAIVLAGKTLRPPGQKNCSGTVKAWMFEMADELSENGCRRPVGAELDRQRRLNCRSLNLI